MDERSGNVLYLFSFAEEKEGQIGSDDCAEWVKMTCHF